MEKIVADVAVLIFQGLGWLFRKWRREQELVSNRFRKQQQEQELRERGIDPSLLTVKDQRPDDLQ